MHFLIETSYNPHLLPGTSRLEALLTLTAALADTPAAAPAPARVFGYIIDCSGSMEGDKLLCAKLALYRQLDLLQDGDRFFIVAFNHEARSLVPLTSMTAQVRRDARGLLEQVRAVGGTVMSAALRGANRQFGEAPGGLCYAQLLTDGQNDDGDAKALAAAIAECQGRFQCDAWGVGVDWEPAQLRLIAQGLLGRADAVTDPVALEQAFREALGSAQGRGLGQVRLRLQTPRSCRIASVQQQSPEIVELLGLAVPGGDGRSVDVPLGAWGSESRDYFVVAELSPQDEGEEALAFRSKVLYVHHGADSEIDGGRVIAHWTADLALAGDIDPQVAHYNGQQELAESIREGLAAKYQGDLTKATLLLGRAVQISAASGNAAVTQRLGRVVEILDAPLGTVRLRPGVDKGAMLELDMGGTRTVRRRCANGQGG